MNSLFGHLAMRFSAGPEVLATEALCYILRKSEAAKQGLLSVAEEMLVSIDGACHFDTQASEEEVGRPDLVGYAEGETKILIEVKYWAGLTDHQPVSYLQRLDPVSDALLLFIAPKSRLASLWNELLRRCREAGLSLATAESKTAFAFRARTGHDTTLALTSWHHVLRRMEDHALDAEDDPALDDIRQLQGLCERMDDEAFLPLRADDIAQKVGRRILDMQRLADQMGQTFRDEGLRAWSSRRDNPSHGKVYYDIWCQVHDINATLRVNYEWWAKWGDSPLWLELFPGTHKHREVMTRALRARMPDVVIYKAEKPDGSLRIPVPLTLGVEEAQVLRDMRGFFEEIGDALAEATWRLCSPETDS